MPACSACLFIHPKLLIYPELFGAFVSISDPFPFVSLRLLKVQSEFLPIHWLVWNSPLWQVPLISTSALPMHCWFCCIYKSLQFPQNKILLHMSCKLRYICLSLQPFPTARSKYNESFDRFSKSRTLNWKSLAWAVALLATGTLKVCPGKTNISLWFLGIDVCTPRDTASEEGFLKIGFCQATRIHNFVGSESLMHLFWPKVSGAGLPLWQNLWVFFVSLRDSCECCWSPPRWRTSCWSWRCRKIFHKGSRVV